VVVVNRRMADLVEQLVLLDQVAGGAACGACSAP
jgi:hypothetical protein